MNPYDQNHRAAEYQGILAKAFTDLTHKTALHNHGQNADVGQNVGSFADPQIKLNRCIQRKIVCSIADARPNQNRTWSTGRLQVAETLAEAPKD